MKLMLFSKGYYDDLKTLVGYFYNPGSQLNAESSRAAKILGINTHQGASDLFVAIDILSETFDIQDYLIEKKKLLTPEGRLLVTCYNVFLRPFFAVAEFFRIKNKDRQRNWLSENDIYNFCELSGYEVIRTGTRCLLPWRCLGLGAWINRWLAPLPIFKRVNIYGYYLLRPKKIKTKSISSVSVIVPARNEAGNIENALRRLPRLAPKVELIFVEGNSKDNTWQKIQEIRLLPRPDWLSVEAYQQSGKGKANAVHLGFKKATGELLMILDADLTVPPEELPRFMAPIEEGIADFTHGSRLVYPMEGEAMRFLNILGNKFFSMAFTFVLGQRFKDTLCGTKVFYKEDWQKILNLREYFGDFDPFGDFEMIFGATKLNHKILEVPVHYKARTYGETQISRFTHGTILLRMLVFAATRMKFLKTERI